MIFEALYRSAQDGELVLVDGGYLRYHRRRDGQITICEVIVLPACQRRGIGQALVSSLVAMQPGSILAKCPADLPSNGFYAHLGFALEDIEHSRVGRTINVWRWQRQSTS